MATIMSKLNIQINETRLKDALSEYDYGPAYCATNIRRGLSCMGANKDCYCLNQGLMSRYLRIRYGYE